MTAFRVNGRAVTAKVDPDMPLLWWLRDHAGLTGAKFGCGVGQPGMVLIDGAAMRSCVTPVSSLAGREVTTIEGLARGEALHPVQQAWIEEDVAQCGYCQAGQILAAVDLLRRSPKPSEAEIAAIGNLCRCGTYPRIRRAIRKASGAEA
jgi:isoquinoline 1-oxidoreductase subunit alpha